MDDLGYETVPPGETGNIGLTAAVPVSTGAVHTVSVELGGGGDNGLAFADGTVTATYYPFGSTGGNILSTRTAANAKDGSLRTQGTNRFEEESDGRCSLSSHRVSVLGGRPPGLPPQPLADNFPPATAEKRPNDLLDRDLEASDDAGVAASRR